MSSNMPFSVYSMISKAPIGIANDGHIMLILNPELSKSLLKAATLIPLTKMITKKVKVQSRKKISIRRLPRGPASKGKKSIRICSRNASTLAAPIITIQIIR